MNIHNRTTAGFGITAGQGRFANVPAAEIQRSVLPRNHGLTTTMDPGILYPCFWDEALPGDTFSLSMNSFLRQLTPLFPTMHETYLDFHFFAVPNRLLWDNWQKFCGEQESPGDSTDFLVPIMTAPSPGGHAEDSLSDFFGLPTKIPNLEHMSLFHRAYALIWNEWFRDQNLQDPIAVPLGDGPDDPADFPLLRRGKRHDYFTSCLPFVQKGPNVELPLGQDAPVSIISDGDGIPQFQSPNTSGQAGLDAAVVTGNVDYGLIPSQNNDPLSWADPKLAGTADLTAATAATINMLREAFQIQRLFERDARGGTRYVELLKAHFGVVSPDFRLQRPEFLGSKTARVNVNPVANTSQLGVAGAPADIGELGAYVTASADGAVFTKSFVEHCVIIGLVSVRADLKYQQGLERMFSRRTRFDFYWPAFAHLGEQAVLNKEIFAQGPDVLNGSGTPVDDDAFGFQERWAEYRYKPSRVTGRFRSNADQSLDPWTLVQDFAALPVLDGEFIEENPPLARTIRVTTEPIYKLDLWFNYRCARPMPTYSVPGMIDHF